MEEKGRYRRNALVHKLPAEVFPIYFLIRLNVFNKA